MAFDVPCPEQDELPNEPGCQLRCQRMWRGGWSYGRGRNGSRSRGARAPADACKHAYQLCAQLPSCKTVQINKAGTWATLKSRNVSAAEQQHAKAAVRSRLRRFDRTQGVPVLHACSQHSQPAAPAFQAAGSKGIVDVSDGAATLSKQGFALLADLERVQSTGSCRNVQVRSSYAGCRERFSQQDVLLHAMGAKLGSCRTQSGEAFYFTLTEAIAIVQMC
eukprot:6175869-Pleurochrysis_carterae.AAC.4